MMAFSFHNSTIILRGIFSHKVQVFSLSRQKWFMSQKKLAAVCGFQITIIFATLQLKAIRTPVQQETKIVFPSIFFMQLFSHITIEQSSYSGADVFILTLNMYLVQHCLLFLVIIDKKYFFVTVGFLHCVCCGTLSIYSRHVSIISKNF